MPQPASLKGAKGVRFEKATEVTADLVRFIEDPSVAKEGYDLRIEPEGIAVSASTETGRFYALETLKQLALPRLGKLAFPGANGDRPQWWGSSGGGTPSKARHGLLAERS